MTVDHLYWIEKIQPSQRCLVGDTAFYLSQLARQNYPVVPSFVVGAPALREFLENHNWEEPLFAELLNASLHLNVDDPRQLKAIAEHIRQEIIAAELPQSWVDKLARAADRLRSEALSFRPCVILPPNTGTTPEIVGLLERHVCQSDREELALALLQTWAELFRARSLFYWQRSQVDLQQLNLAVLVQPLWRARAAGSLHRTEAGVEIQATCGLAMAIELGQVIPDVYQIDLETGETIAQKLGNKSLAYDLILDNPPSENLKAETSLLSTYSCLQPYLLEEERQQQFALESRELQAAIELAQKLSHDLDSSFALEWFIAQGDRQDVPQLYLSGATVGQPIEEKPPKPNPSSHAPPLSTSPIHSQGETMPPQIVGIAAAPGTAIARAYTIAADTDPPQNLSPGQILVATEIAPHWLPIVRHCAGLVTERGGMTSHAAILAREFRIPAVVGAKGITQQIQTGDSVLVNGDTGEVVLVATQPANLTKHNPPVNGLPPAFDPPPDPSAPSLPLQYPIATQLFVNLSHPSSLERNAELPVDGVGLLRSEMMALEIFQSQHPRQWIEAEGSAAFVERMAAYLMQVAEFFFPRPVFYRSLDLRGADASLGRSPGELGASPSSSSQTFGLHGAFSYLLDPALFDLELEAIARVQDARYTNVRLMIPFVRSVEEFTFCRRRVERVGLDRISEFQLWIVAEVPSAIFLLEDYVKAGVEGIAIGTNDLTQLLLAADRENQQMSAAFDARHPAVMRAVRQLIVTAKRCGIPCSICGLAPTRYPETIDRLVRWGIDGISVEPDAIGQTYRAIARAEQRLLLQSARDRLLDSDS